MQQFSSIYLTKFPHSKAQVSLQNKMSPEVQILDNYNLKNYQITYFFKPANYVLKTLKLFCTNIKLKILWNSHTEFLTTSNLLTLEIITCFKKIFNTKMSVIKV